MTGVTLTDMIQGGGPPNPNPVQGVDQIPFDFHTADLLSNKLFQVSCAINDVLNAITAAGSKITVNWGGYYRNVFDLGTDAIGVTGIQLINALDQLNAFVQMSSSNVDTANKAAAPPPNAIWAPPDPPSQP